MTEREQQWNKCMGLARAMARMAALKTPGSCFDDYLQAALMGAWMATATHDPAGAPIFSYARKRMLGEIRKCQWRLDAFGFKACRAAWKVRNEVPRMAYLTELVCEGTEPTTDPEGDFDDLDLVQVLLTAVDNVDNRQAAEMFWLKGMTHRQISVELGIAVHTSEQRVSRARKQMEVRAKSLQKEWDGERAHAAYNGFEFVGACLVRHFKHETGHARHARRYRHANHHETDLRIALNSLGLVLIRDAEDLSEFVICHEQKVIAVWNPSDGALEWDTQPRKCHDWEQCAWFCKNVICKEMNGVLQRGQEEKSLGCRV